MRKLKTIILVLVSFFAINVKVYAASGNLSVSSTNVYVGDSFTVSANLSSVAAWNVHVSSSGPVSGCLINQVDATDDAMDTNKVFSVTCTATGAGNINIQLSGDVTSASNGNAVAISDSKNVVATSRPTTSNNNSTVNNNSNNSNKVQGNPNSKKENETKSTNNKLKSISVEGYELKKINPNSYTISVPNDVTTINIKAIAEDSKSKIVGDGNHKLNIGDNDIELVVTSEDGVQNKIVIKATRKDGYYLDDLVTTLTNNNIKDINIIIDSNTKLSSEYLEKIKESGKIVKLNYYDKDKNLLYNWTIDGSKIKNTNDLLTTILYSSDYQKNMSKLSNYSEGMYISLKQTKNIPEGTKIKIYVGNKYKDNVLVNVYAYDKNGNKLNLISKEKVKDGYIEFDVSNSSDYLITRSSILNIGTSLKDTNNKFSLPTIIIGIVLSSIVGGVLLFLMKRTKVKKKSQKSLHDSNIYNFEELNNYMNQVNKR